MSLVCLALAAAQPGPCAQAASWRAVATDADRRRLREARDAWTEALAEPRLKGTATDPLFDPDRALDTPLPPAGGYRCRFVKIGGAVRFATRDWGRCEVSAEGLVKLDGPQRPTGRLFADGEGRGVFLGTLLLGDETRPLRYGRDDGRDLAGFVERVGEGRWRIALPRPAFESTLDLLELVSA